MAGKNLSKFYERDAPSDEENTWAVSYGDMISVLLCFFILLLSISVINPNKYESIKRTVEGNLGQETSIEALEGHVKNLLREEQLEGAVSVEKNDLGVDIAVRDLLFASGEARLNEQGQLLFFKLQEVFKNLPKEYRFEIEGHTDDVPIDTPQFPSNWYLSAARGLSVLDIFLGSDFDARRFRVQGFADTQPVVPNTNEENRSINRRVVVKVR